MIFFVRLTKYISNNSQFHPTRGKKIRGFAVVCIPHLPRDFPQVLGAPQVRRGRAARRDFPATVHRAVPRQRHRRVDGVRAARVLGGRPSGHGDPEGVVAVLSR